MARCYEVKAGNVYPRITLKEPGCIHLGEDRRGCKLTIVPIPPEAEIRQEEDKKFMTSVPYGTDAAVVVVRDHSGYRGSWELKGDNVRILAKGHIGQGSAGRVGGGPEYLLVLRPGDTFVIERSGRLYGKPARYRVRYERGVLSICDADREDETKELGGIWSTIK